MARFVFSFTLMFVLSIFILLPCVFSQEDITITTYYPAPKGVYKDLRSEKLAIGDDYINNSQYCWEGTCTDPIDADADLIVEGNVGIGTISPRADLEVAGNMLLAPMSQPSSPQPGMIYYDKSDHKMYYYRGGPDPKWIPMGGGGKFGDWVLVSDNTQAIVSRYADTDGIVTAHTWDGHLSGYTDKNSDPSTLVINHNLYHSGSGSGITFPVKEGDYWKVTTAGGDGKIDKVYWIPLGE